MTNGWDGNFEKLSGLESCFIDDPMLCDETFSSKHEAFTAGLFCATRTLATRREGDSVAESIAVFREGGLVRWNRKWRSGSPVWVVAVPTDTGRG